MRAGPSVRRLLGPEVGQLLNEMTALAPGLELAVVDLAGQVVHKSDRWPAVAPGDAASTVGEGSTRQLALAPRSEAVALLVARGVAPQPLLTAIQHTLSLLLREAIDKHELARETLERYREINLLYRAGASIGALLDTAEVPRVVLAETARAIPASAAFVLLTDASPADVANGDARGSTDELDGLRRAAGSLIGAVTASRRPDIAAWPAARPPAPSSALCAPILAGEQLLGLIVLGRSADAPDFDAGEEKLLLGLAAQAGVALERAQLYERETRRQRLEEELAVARRIQLALLPARTPAIEGWTFAATYHAAREVGGDFYDFLDHRPTPHLGLLIADVTGKGVPAALMMAYSRAVMRAEAMAGREPAEVLERTNRLIMQERQARLFLTAFYADLDVDSGRLLFASAGHEPPLWLPAEGGCRELAAQGVLLGAFDDTGLEARAAELAPGDAVVLYTDGVTEARDPHGALFGDERLVQAALAARGSAQAVLDAIADAVVDFTADAEQADDLTVVVIRRDDTPPVARNDVR